MGVGTDTDTGMVATPTSRVWVGVWFELPLSLLLVPASGLLLSLPLKLEAMLLSLSGELEKIPQTQTHQMKATMPYKC